MPSNLIEAMEWEEVGMPIGLYPECAQTHKASLSWGYDHTGCTMGTSAARFKK